MHKKERPLGAGRKTMRGKRSKKANLFRRIWQTKWTRLVVFIVVFGLVGTVMVLFSRAETNLLTITPSDDAFVKDGVNQNTVFQTQDKPAYILSVNKAGAPCIEQPCDTQNSREAYLKFNVSGIGTSQVTGVKLRLFVLDASAKGGDLYTTSSNSANGEPWTETNLTWNTKPTGLGTKLASQNRVEVGTWIEYTLPSSAITSDGTYAFKIIGTDANIATYASKDYGDATYRTGSLAPRLEITTADITAPTVKITKPAAGTTLSGTGELLASASDNIGVVRVEFYANSIKIGDAVKSSAGWSYKWSTASVPNGSYSLNAKAFDAAGNTKTSSGVAVTIANTSSSNACEATATKKTLTTFSDYVKQSGDQVITVPNGTYKRGAEIVTAPHAATSGPCKGWLVLKAESKGGVKIDLGGWRLKLDSSTNRVAFVGIEFYNGRIDAEGSDSIFWYTDHTWPQQNGMTQETAGLNFWATTSTRNKVYGSSVHDSCDAINGNGSKDTLLQGVKIYGLSEGYDPNDQCHADAIEMTNGNSDGFRIKDSWIQGRSILKDAKGPITNFSVENTWVTGTGFGHNFNLISTTSRKSIQGRMTNVRSWIKSGCERVEIFSPSNPRCNSYNYNTSRIEITSSNFSKTAPSDLSQNPADLWRKNNPYSSWYKFLY